MVMGLLPVWVHALKVPDVELPPALKLGSKAIQLDETARVFPTVIVLLEVAMRLCATSTPTTVRRGTNARRSFPRLEIYNLESSPPAA